MKQLSYIFILFMFCNCAKDQPVASPLLIPDGQWEEMPTPCCEFSGSEYSVIFKEDSFFIKINHFTDIKTNAPCREDYWIEHAAGKYEFTSDSLLFSGVHTDPSYQLKTSGCNFEIGPFNKQFSYIVTTDPNIIILNPESDIYAQIKLQRK
jgi:hypothetical protein